MYSFYQDWYYFDSN